MPEIKTCEQYVLRELENKEKEIEKLNNTLDMAEGTVRDLKKEIADYRRLVELLEIKAKPTTSVDGEVVEGKALYSWNYEKGKFEEAKALCIKLGLCDETDMAAPNED